ncbi:UNVERIFIED_CONTAM: hypothetical protein Slati_4436000 [Sesamum latifolium]|uniref:DUF4216 domain-containing protein n=1 Tax=Sesamum latifolium TaxID=2727402 RepID=A0AAW2SS70_9LAMI
MFPTGVVWTYLEGLYFEVLVNKNRRKRKRLFLNELYEHYQSEDPIIEELVATQFKNWFKRRIVLFKCRWVDPMHGMKVHPRYHQVDVNFKKVYQKNEPFILAQQAVQVYYIEYPSMKRDKVDWLVVYQIKARRVIDVSHWTEVAFQEDEIIPTPKVLTDNRNHKLHDPNGIQLVLRSDRRFHERINAVVREHFPHPLPCPRQVPTEHQHFWFDSMKITYWWDCDDEFMFRVFHMWVGKYIRKTFSVARSSQVKPLWLANEIWLQLQAYWASEDFKQESSKNKANRAKCGWLQSGARTRALYSALVLRPTSPPPPPPPPPNPTLEDPIGRLEEMMVDMMVMMWEMRASSSTGGPSQPTASSTAPAQPPTDPQPPNDDEMGGLE